jgi:hypothetical protein
MTADEKREIRELQELVRQAQSALAGLQHVCKVHFLRIGQVKVLSPNLNGLVEPMDWETAEILEGIIGAQAAHQLMEDITIRMLKVRVSGGGHG